MSVSPSAVSQQIKLLEQQLGVKLFRRESRQLSLTLEGEQLYQTCSTALRMLRDARNNLAKTHDSRRLSLRVSPSFGVRWLGPRLSGFLEAHPDWDLRIDAAPDPTDFDREVMDLDIRYGTGQWMGLNVKPMVNDRVLPLASPDYLAKLKPDADVGALFDQASLIDSARAICQWDYWLMRNEISTSANRKSILMDRSSMAIQLAVDGAGIVLESLALASQEVAQGLLVPVTPQLPVFTFPAYWAICPSRYLHRRSVRLFLSWLEQEVAAHDAEISEIAKTHGLQFEMLEAGEDFAAT